MYFSRWFNNELRNDHSVPVKIDKITFIADLYVLKVDHISMIIGCDLLKSYRQI